MSSKNRLSRAEMLTRRVHRPDTTRPAWSVGRLCCGASFALIVAACSGTVQVPQGDDNGSTLSGGGADGVAVADVSEEEMSRSGFIGLQVHGVARGAGPFEVSWRNLQVKGRNDRE